METDFEKPYVIGLDMGGTNSIFGIVDQRGTIKAQTAIKTRAYPDVRDYVKAAAEALQPALDVVGGISTRGPWRTDHWSTGCAARRIAGYPSRVWISAERI